MVPDHRALELLISSLKEPPYILALGRYLSIRVPLHELLIIIATRKVNTGSVPGDNFILIKVLKCVNGLDAMESFNSSPQGGVP